jgi:hypothetical protein
MIRPITIAGKRFELTLRTLPDGVWHWVITAPGQFVLSGDATSEVEAFESARAAAETLARLAA